MKKHWYKDMHYAEFAEDEVCSQWRTAHKPTQLHAVQLLTRTIAEPSLDERDQGV